MTLPDTIIGADLDALLAPLDDIARLPVTGEPSTAQTERAYALALLAAELTINPPSLYLLEVLDHYGVAPDDALTIGRALSGVALRVSGWMDGM
jgi:hypothetical protein